MSATDLVLKGKRCLVLDDEFLIALDIQQILEAAGAAEVVCTGTAADALKALESGPFDAAVLDVKLGSSTRTSLAVAAALADRRTPFIFLTGMREGDVETAQFPHAPVVGKPYEAPLLLQAVVGALARV